MRKILDPKRSFMMAALVAMFGLAGPFAVTAEDLPVFDLSQCIDVALQGSPTLAVSQQNAFIAKQNVRQAWCAFLPSLSSSYTWQKSERTDFDFETYDASTGLPLIFDKKTNYKDKRIGLNASMNLFDGFRNYGGLKSARSEFAAARLDQSAGRQQVIETVARAYINLLRNERLQEVAVEARDLAARELEKSETYHRIGSAARSDVLQAKVRLGQTRLDVIRAQNSVEQSFAELSHAMNRPLANRFEIDRSLLERDYDLSLLETLYEEALVNRPDLLSREYSLDARGSDVKSANAGLLPQVNLFGSYSRSSNESEYRFGAQDSDSKSWGLQVSWDIFDRYQTLAGRSQAKARERIAEYTLEQAQLDAQLEVRQLYNSLIEARERISLSRETIANAEEELRLAQERFKVGAGTTLDTITAQVNLAQARGDEVQALSDYLIASLQLDRAVGRPLDRLMQ